MARSLLRFLLFVLILLPAAAGCVQSPALGPAPTATALAPLPADTATSPANVIGPKPTPENTLAPQPTPTATAQPTSGVLQGHVSIGPLHGGPVRTEDLNATVPPELYAERPLLIYAENGESLLHQVNVNAAGDYWVELPPGRYVVSITLPGRERSGNVPAAVEIRAGETTLLDIAIDTGLR